MARKIIGIEESCVLKRYFTVVISTKRIRAELPPNYHYFLSISSGIEALVTYLHVEDSVSPVDRYTIRILSGSRNIFLYVWCMVLYQ